MAVKHYDVKSFTSSASIGYLIKVAHSLLLERATAIFAERDISFIQWLVLTKLREGVAVTSSDLCRQIHHDTGAFTRLLDQLEERGYIVRERSQQDRRVVQLQLTPAGRKQALELTPLVVDGLNWALGDFSKTEFQEFTRLLNKLIARLTEPAVKKESAP